MNNTMIAPIQEIVRRLHFHAEVGVVNPTSPLSPAEKILDGLKIYDNPQARSDTQDDLPNLVIMPPGGRSVAEPHSAYFVDADVVLELSTSKDDGVAGCDGKSLEEWKAKVILAVLRNTRGDVDHYLAKTITNQVAFSFSDGIPNDSSLLLPITLKWRTKAFQ